MSEKKKKSSRVPAVLITTVAAALIVSGCSSERQVRRCVDDTGKVLEEEACVNPRPHVGHYVGMPRYVYGGTGGNTPGSKAMGFTSTPKSGATVVTPGGKVISRGGFGSSGRSSGFGG